MTQQYRLGKKGTTLVRTKKGGTVTLYATPVVKYSAKRIVLDTGGWFTATTKTRMNQASNQLGLGYGVYQKNRKFYVKYGGKTKAFRGNKAVIKR